MRKSWLAIIIMLIIVSLALAGCGGKGSTPQDTAKGDKTSQDTAKVDNSGKPVPITAAVGVALDHVVSFVGVEKGIFEKYGIDLRLKIVSSGIDQINALQSGEAQFGQAGVAPISSAKAKGVPIIALGLLQGAAYTPKIDSDISIVAREGSNIREGHPEDLKGKTIGVPTGTVAHEYLQAVLAAKNIAENDVKLINIKDSELAIALQTKNVDAIVCWEAFPTHILKNVKGSYLVQRDGGYIARYGVIIAYDDYVKKNPQIVEKYLTAFSESSQWVRQHPDEAAAIACRWISGLDPDVARAAIKNITFDPRVSKYTYNGFKSSIDFLIKMKNLDKPIDVNEVIKPEPMLKVMKEKPELFKDLKEIPAEAKL
jgi:ABC-type nitrate/sulfonate/bicarbonate transport system substrate-binding protein